MNKKSLANLEKRKTFSKDYQPKHNGRPVNRFKALKGQYELSADDLNCLIAELMNLDVADLKTIIQDPTTPVLRASLAAAIVGSLKKGNLDAISILLDRSMGKATQKTEAAVTVNSPNFKVVFDDKDINESADNTPSEEVSTAT